MTKSSIALSTVLLLCITAPAAHSYCYPCRHRNMEARHEFLVETGHPHGWRGHIVDHIVPIYCGGFDGSANMAWQSKEAAARKDEWELNCSLWDSSHPPCHAVGAERLEVCE